MADSFNELFGLGSHSEDANLEGWWPLQDDAASTTIDDASSNNRDGTLNGGDNTADLSTTGPNSWLAKAINFDGTADYIDLGFHFSLGSPITCLVFANLDDLNSIQHVLGVRQGAIATGWFWRLRGDLTGDPWQFTYSGVGAADSTTGPTATSWEHHAVVVNSSNSATFYLDGSADGGGSLGGAMPSHTNNLFCGARNNSADSTIDFFLDGKLCGLAIFSRDLTSAEISQHRAGPEPINSVAPVVSGTETEGQTLSCTTGTWGLDAPFSGGSNGTITYSYQWTRSNDGTGTGEADISGATSSTYTLQAADVGKFIRCRVRASNDGGFDSAADTNSNFTGAISAAGSSVPPHKLTLLGVG